MPALDRRIQVGVQGPPGNDDGTPVPGTWTYEEVWARRTDDSQVIERPSSIILAAVVVRQRYRIRWRADFLEAWTLNRLAVRIGTTNYQVEGVRQIGRNRWMDLEILRPTG